MRHILVSSAILLSVCACAPSEAEAPQLRAVVVATHPHSTDAFTEGLEFAGHTLYESTGLHGHSKIAAVDFPTGSARGDAQLPPSMFGEGITLTGGRLWQLTWQDGIAFQRDPNTLRELHQVRYSGEGWGLCTRRGRLVMSDGTGTLTFRDPDTFAVTGMRTLVGYHKARLNELDCATDGYVYANNWPSDRILRIDPDTGRVTAIIEAGPLRPAPLDSRGDNVLNGIAQLPGTDHFLITGKYWPTSYEVRFVPKR